MCDLHDQIPYYFYTISTHNRALLKNTTLNRDLGCLPLVVCSRGPYQDWKALSSKTDLKFTFRQLESQGGG